VKCSIAVLFVALVLPLFGCKQMRPKPRMATRLIGAPAGVKLDPPPPDYLYWVRIRSGKLPDKTVDNRQWDEVGGAPDPYVVLMRNGKEIMRTDPASDTTEPQWAEPSANYEIKDDDDIEIIVRDADPVGDDLIMGRAKITSPSRDDLQAGRMRVDVGRRGLIYIEFEVAHPMVGLGFDYYVQNGKLIIKEVWEHSPAGRAGLVAHDRVVKIGGTDIRKLGDRSVRSKVNAIGSAPVEIVVQQDSGSSKRVMLGVGPIYPLYVEYGEID
jgi:hypothetical protein